MKKFSSLSVVFFLLCFITTSFLKAQNFYPSAVHHHVNDFAHLLSANDQKQLEDTLLQLQQQTGVQLVVVTVEAIEVYKTGDSNIESFSKNIFNHWGIGDKTKNNGILLLVDVQNRKVRIELGSGYGAKYDASMQQVIDQSILPAFKDNQYSVGLLQGTQAVIDVFFKQSSWFSVHKWELVLGGAIFIFVVAGISAIRSGKKSWGWAFLGFAGALLIFLLTRIFRKNSGSYGSGFGGGSSSGGGATGRW